MNIFIITIFLTLIFTALVDLNVGIAYYQVLKWFVIVGAILCGINFYKQKKQNLFYIFCAITILFNPIVPIFLTKSIWRIIDIIVAVIFLIAVLKINKDT